MELRLEITGDDEKRVNAAIAMTGLSLDQLALEGLVIRLDAAVFASNGEVCLVNDAREIRVYGVDENGRLEY